MRFLFHLSVLNIYLIEIINIYNDIETRKKILQCFFIFILSKIFQIIRNKNEIVSQ